MRPTGYRTCEHLTAQIACCMQKATDAVHSMKHTQPTGYEMREAEKQIHRAQAYLWALGALQDEIRRVQRLEDLGKIRTEGDD